MEIAVVALALECLALYWGQRYIFGLTAQRSRLAAYVLSMPGTILHEASHWLMCKLLGVPTGRVELFRPRVREDGAVLLGHVMHARVDPLRQTLVSIAPLLLVPPFMVALLRLLFGAELLSDPIEALSAAPLWAKLVGGYLLVSTGAAAFPSPGDHIPLGGAVLLGLFAAGVVYLVGPGQLEGAVKAIAVILAPASLSAVLQLALLGWGRR